MTKNDQMLAHSLKIKFGLPPNEPSEEQLSKIKRDIHAIYKPTNSDWHRIIVKYCPKAGSYHYSGLDNSDLNTLLSLAIDATK
ncbi:MAG: hypothetical protein PHI97_30495 [Desulfobulbus sp.]|nr:hypothetical protein [Desulfobulbus sp.]